MRPSRVELAGRGSPTSFSLHSLPTAPVQPKSIQCTLSRRRHVRPAAREEATLKQALILNNTIQEYPWGSHTAIAGLLGLPFPSERPQAELWMGAHPKAPSTVSLEGREVPLDELIDRDPEGVLGRKAARRFGGELPFLFKVIAAAAPLSIQVHPTSAQAREGFIRENEAGIAMDAFERNYRDPHHKPEVLCVLAPFRALAGFRPIPEMLELLGAAGAASLGGAIERLTAEPTAKGLERFFGTLMRLEPGHRRRVTEEALAWASGRRSGSVETGVLEDAPPLGTGRPRAATPAEVRRAVLRLHAHYPGDIGALAPLIFNLVELEPGETVYLKAGIPHAYLEGVGIELMANSDNVLRGGLTPKHVDVPELLRTLRFESAPLELVPARTRAGGETVFRTPAEEFELSVIELGAGRELRARTRRSVEILLCESGAARLAPLRTAGGNPGSLEIRKGVSVLVPAAAPAYRLEGQGRLFKATVP